MSASRGRPAKFTEAQAADVLARRAAGESLGRIADAVGVTKAQANYICQSRLQSVWTLRNLRADRAEP